MSDKHLDNGLEKAKKRRLDVKLGLLAQILSNPMIFSMSCQCHLASFPGPTGLGNVLEKWQRKGDIGPQAHLISGRFKGEPAKEQGTLVTTFQRRDESSREKEKKRRGRKEVHIQHQPLS